MKLLETHKVPETEIDQRLSDYAQGIFESIASRKGLKKAIERGRVKINGEIGKTGDFVKGGETIELFAKKQKRVPRIDVEFDVLFEDEHLAVVNKPAGIVVSGNQKWTLENGLPMRLKKSDEMDALPRPEAIHRLDFPTSGALLIGKTAKAVRLLNKLFETRDIQKCYHAICIGDVPQEIEFVKDIKGKSAKTSLKCLKSLPSDKYNKLNLVELIPETGRRHQLRIHLSEAGYPILGDQMYGEGKKIMKGKGLFLHASSLSFEHPITNEALKVEADLPKKFGSIFKD